ncbi:ABC transporter ATP-binding protein [Ferrovum sp. PN-J185]|uniref:ABC transporter ATP-binding protein n=1 Tax=Ferrovum sp. PN-J185 TaxID=1356306 RepID=UPI000799F06E|nr:ABC transporter ATP-binding protein [Ferrovum sp. PN-J185]KXW55524.1 high-affinity branched-chain amino acid transport ATP-binding protein LivF [Ferrovum sp. PN-J185]MCC6067919.1 ABC transporter ATP-binding protein [Ferrovum sp. PN-J185]MDE1891262.1 ABC transporter ATP-binding protein [Betaproteobacteria bacterium]MDE2056302.1 ABC transporter ATP-binding protein [Betaproteobacteria bacterium]
MLLEVKQLSVSYGGIQAVRDISFHINSGERVTIIGANGAGKSSTLKALAGLVRIEKGTVLFNDKLINTVPAFSRVSQGLCLVPEGRGIFQRMSIEENLWMGAYSRSVSSLKQHLDQVYAIFPRLYERRLQNAGTLSGGEQQMLAIGRALLSQPQLLMLDEPSMGLAPQMVDHLFEIIGRVVETGVSLLLIEQNARLALNLCDRAYVMDTGEIVLAESAAACLNHPLVQQAYLG